MSSDYGMNQDSAIQNRKFAKTCVEKKRRDRINRCLDELKDLMSQADDKAKYQKMEKAEILEMAVNYMKNLRTAQPSSVNTCNNISGDNSSMQYYSLAFKQCLSEFQNYLALFPGIKDDFKSNIMSYMTQRYMENISSKKNPQLKRKTTTTNRYTPYQSERQSSKNENIITVMTNENLSLISSSNSSFSSSSYLCNSENKFGGSCSSLDGFFVSNNKHGQPINSESSSDSHNESLRSSNSENLMSPAMSSSSPCSSPVSNTNQIDTNSSSPINYFSNYDDFMKVWRPW